MDKNKKTEEEIRFDNEVKKLKLKAEHGAQFGAGDISLPAEVESQWLDYINDFENFCKKHGTKKVKEVIGKPSFPPEKSLSDEELPKVLDDLTDLLHTHEISLSVLYETPDREIYRFITEELLEEEMQIIPIPGMFTQFTYEEFHPNDEEDLRQYTEEFLKMLLSLDFTYMDFLLSPSCQLGNEVMESKVFVSRLQKFLDPIESMSLINFNIHSIEINDDSSKVDFQLIYEIKLNNKPKSENTDKASLNFKHQYGYWYVRSVNIPGLNIQDN
ncbi:MAG: hypothetical protein RLO17_00610 [Cyclobacteriaceae bacterium]|jgi:hypothetical protein